MTVRRGFVTGVDVEYREAFPLAGDLDLDFVEVAMEGPHQRHQLREEAGEIRALADAYDLSLLVHLPFRLDLASPYDRVREGAIEECEEALEAAGTVDALKAVVHARTDAVREAYDDETLRDRFVEAVLDLDSYADHVGMELCVENQGDGFVTFREGFPRLFEEGVSVCLDTGYAHATGLDATDQAALLVERPEAITHLHLTDARLAGGRGHLPFGTGGIDFERLLEPAGDGWSGTVALDPFATDAGDVEESVRRLDALL